MPHLLISTGEVSGDLQGSYLVTALRRHCPELQISALGGQRMAAAGATLLQDTTGISAVGIVEALPFILPTLLLGRRVKRFLRQASPDLVVLIDYIGVNSRVGPLCDQAQVPVVYYIAPQEWVWRQSLLLTYKLVDFTKLFLSIFQAEATYYEAAGGKVQWVGHPLLDIMAQAPTRQAARRQLGLEAEALMVALVPASRPQEVRAIAPVLLAAAQRIRAQLPQAQFWLPLARPRFQKAIARQAQRLGLPITFAPTDSQTLLAAADLVLAKSGTVNLETVLLDVPQVVVYRVNPLTYWIGKRVLRIDLPLVSPANLAVQKEVVPELIQGEANPERIAAEALEILTNPQRRQQMHRDYADIRQNLGEPGVVDRAAIAILAQMGLLPS